MFLYSTFFNYYIEKIFIFYLIYKNYIYNNVLWNSGINFYLERYFINLCFLIYEEFIKLFKIYKYYHKYYYTNNIILVFI